MPRPRIWSLPPLCLILAACGQDTGPLALGTLERERIALTATAAEVIVELPVPEGSRLTAGTVIARLDDRVQRAAVARSQAEVARAAAELEKRRRGPRPQEIAAARARVAGAEAALRETQITFERNQDLIERKAVSQAELDHSLALRDGAEAALEEARQVLAELLAGTRVEDLDAAQAALDAAQAQLDRDRALLAELTIVATRDGVLDSLPWNLGERVTVGSPIAIMLADAAPYARVYVPEPFRVRVKPGDSLAVRIDGLTQPIMGRVRWISSEPAFTPYYALNQDDRSRLMFLAEVQLPASAADLPSGVPAQVVLPQVALP